MDYLTDVGYVDPVDCDDLDQLRREAAAERRDLEYAEKHDQGSGSRLSVEAVIARLQPCAECPDPGLCAAEAFCPRGEA